MKKFIGILITIFAVSFICVGQNNGTFTQNLYRLRHRTYEITHQGSAYGSGTKVIKFRYIYRDNGRKVNEYVVDLNGNIRNDMPHTNFDKAYPIVDYYSVPKEIRILAKKSLE